MNIEALRKVRSTVRRSATDTIKLLETEINKDKKSVDLIDELLAKLLDKKSSLEKLDSEILNLCKIDEIEKETEKQQEYKDKCITWKVRANKILRKEESEIKTNESNVIETRCAQQSTVKLPRLQIPQYDGNILKFNDFYSQFEAAIHKNSSLNSVEKFNYLKSYLTNEAEIAIRGLSLNSENYEVALNILKERFGRKDVIIDVHMSRLLNLNPVRKSYDIIALRRLYAECETHIRGLENNGINTDSYSCLLYPVLLKSIPRDLSLEFSRRTHSKNKNEISDLLEFLKIEIQCRERNENLIREFNANESDARKESKFKIFDKSTQNYKTLNKNKFDYDRKFKINSNVPNTSAFAVNVRKCIFCIQPENDHDSVSCPLSIEQRKVSLRKNGLCYLCLSKGHIYKQCKSKRTCSNCTRKHSELVCESPPACSPTIEISPSMECGGGTGQRGSETPQKVLASKVITCSNVDDCEILLETCSAVLMSNSQNRAINILLDNGSQRCFLKKELAIDMKLPIIRQESLLVYTFGSREPIRKTYDVVQCTLYNSRDPEKRITIEALLTDVISGSPFRVSTNKLKQVLKSKNINLSNVSESIGNELSLLIGAQYFWDIHSGEKERLSKSLFLIDTMFGKVIQGRIYPSGLNYIQNASMMKIECCAALNEKLTQFWQLDSMGINDTYNETSKCDEEFISQFESNLKFKNGMYETKLFWNEKPNNLDDNFAVAKRRFDNLSIKMKENNWLLDEYKAIVSEQLKLNIVEECSSDFQRNSFYMPHSAVVRTDKDTTKVRLVFDASSKGKGRKSLNDCLNSGPSLNPRILDVILQFREYKYAFSSDIQGAFLTIGIHEEDRDYLRFFWFPDENDSTSYKILRMTRVPFGVTSSPFILAAIIKYHIRKYKQERHETYEMLNSSLYVDDLFYGANTVDKALELSQSAVKILRDANMNLRKFKTNSDELRSLWYERGMSEAREANERPSKVLGIIWNSVEDTLKLDVQPLLDMIKDVKNSKRSVLQTIVEKIISSPVWLQGPEWLRMSIEEWPKSPTCEFAPEVSRERRTELDEISSFVCEVQSNMTQILNLNKYSSLRKLCRVTSWVLRFIYNTRYKVKRFEELSAEELDGAEKIWVKSVQGEIFAEEVSNLRQGKPISRTSSILELNPFLGEDGIMHVGGRLQKSKLSYLRKHPMIMPPKHHFVNLLVWDSHSKVFHGGVSETLMEIRERYWLIKGRQTVKNTLKKCVLCKRFNSTSGVQVTAPLPSNRIEQSPPFSVVGIDFGGPLYTTNSDEKNYIVLFTCGVTRALHLELVGSLTTETFLLALRRFISRRGLCYEILTDNAKTFKRSELELKNLWTVISHTTVRDFYASHKIQWRYIAEKAAWWGGFYERLIRSVKLALRKTLRKTTLSREELETDN